MFPFLEVKNLSISFGGLRALQDINMTVMPREIVALLSRSDDFRRSLLQRQPVPGTLRIIVHEW